MDYIELDKIDEAVKCVECNELITENRGTDENPLCKSCYQRMAHEYGDNAPTKQPFTFRETVMKTRGVRPRQ